MFCAALALVIMAAWSVELAERRIWVAEQQSKVDDIASNLERQAATDSAYLAAMGSLLGNVGSPSPLIFRNYVGQLRGISELNGVIGLGWIERFDEDDLADLRQRLLLPSGNRDDEVTHATIDFSPPAKWPVYLIGMLQDAPGGSRWSATLDTGAQDPWIPVMDRVMKAGSVASGDWTEDAQAGARTQSPSFVILAPARSPRGTEGFQGVAFGLVRTKDFVATAIDPGLMRGGRIEIVKRATGGETRIFQSIGRAGRLAAPLSKEVQALLGVSAKALDPSAVISLILKAQVDLLWFGGIGTYIKGADENNAEVGDPANDAHRVNCSGSARCRREQGGKVGSLASSTHHECLLGFPWLILTLPIHSYAPRWQVGIVRTSQKEEGGLISRHDNTRRKR